MVQYLRKQQDILSAELQLAQQESSRLRNEAALARRAAEAANAQLAGQAERSRASARTEEEHTALMQKLEQLNLLRESNAALRCVLPCALRLGHGFSPESFAFDAFLPCQLALTSCAQGGQPAHAGRHGAAAAARGAGRGPGRAAAQRAAPAARSCRGPGGRDPRGALSSFSPQQAL